MAPSLRASAPQQRTALFLVCLLMFTTMPLLAPGVSADGARNASITVTPIPSALEVNPGEAGEYIIRVRNDGSNPITVQLSSAQDAGNQDCNSYSSTITQIPGPIDSGSYEEATMNVSLTQTAEGDCDTTVTVNAEEQATPPDIAGAPAQETATVTTTAGDGSGSAVFGVDLTISAPDKVWGGEDEVQYSIEVENTGQTNETIALSVDQNGGGEGCNGNADDFEVVLSETSVNVDQEESETVTATIEVPEGQSAKTYCWEVTGTVTNDPSQEAKDTEEFQLEIPILKECSVELSKTSISVKPGEQSTVTATYANEGNAEWTISTGVFGGKADWVSVDGPSSGLLRYDDGDGTISFDFIVSPDDTTAAGSESVVKILGKESNSVKCEVELRIIAGQSYGASISIATTTLPNIEPGSNGTTSLTVTNQGNGPDNLRVSSSSAPNGWVIQLEETTVSVGSKHGNDDAVSVGLTVRVPQDALATEEIELTFNVLPSSGGAAYDSVILKVTVAAVHGMEIEIPATDQTGRSGTEVRFPITIVNDGNVRDTIGLAVVSQTSSPGWATSFETEEGMKFTETEVNARSSALVYLVVSIDGEEELDNSRLTVRVRNTDDPNGQDKDGDGIPDNQRQAVFVAILSDRNFAMDARLVDTTTATTASSVLPPNGEETYGLWVRNTGDGTDNAVFSLSGLEGIATRTLTLYGLPVVEEVQVPKGYGIWDLTEKRFVVDESGAPILDSSSIAAEQTMVDLELVEGHEVRVFELYFELTLRVNPGAETGQGGLLEIVVTSVSNAANRSGMVSISLDVSIVQDIEFVEQGARQELDVTYGERITHEVSFVNIGNIETEVRVFASENLRGWSVVLESDDGDCTYENADLICIVSEGERLYLNVTVRPPYGAELDDTYKFTLSAEPTETGVLDRQNLEFAVSGSSDDSVLGLAGNASVQIIAGGFVVALLVAFFLRRD